MGKVWFSALGGVGFLAMLRGNFGHFSGFLDKTNRILFINTAPNQLGYSWNTEKTHQNIKQTVLEFVQTYWGAKSSNFTWSWCEAILFQDSPSRQLIYGVRLVRSGYIKHREDQFSVCPWRWKFQTKSWKRRLHLESNTYQVQMSRLVYEESWCQCCGPLVIPNGFSTRWTHWFVHCFLGGFQAGWISGNKHKFMVDFHQIFQNTLQWSSEKTIFQNLPRNTCWLKFTMHGQASPQGPGIGTYWEIYGNIPHDCWPMLCKFVKIPSCEMSPEW